MNIFISLLLSASHRCARIFSYTSSLLSTHLRLSVSDCGNLVPAALLSKPNNVTFEAPLKAWFLCYKQRGQEKSWDGLEEGGNVTVSHLVQLIHNIHWTRGLQTVFISLCMALLSFTPLLGFSPIHSLKQRGVISSPVFNVSASL